MIRNTDVDVLGRYESEPGAENPFQVMTSLVKHGVLQEWFVPDAVLFQSEDELILYNANEEKQIYSFALSDISNVVAFVKEESATSGFNQVVIFSVRSSGHFGNNVFIAVQCLNSDHRKLAEQIQDAAGLERSRSRRMSAASSPSISVRAGPAPTSPSYASVHRRPPSTASGTNSFVPQHNRNGSVSSENTLPRSSMVMSPRVPEQVHRENALGLLDRPSVQHDHSTDPVEKDTILMNYCIEDIERLCRELKESREGVKGARSLDTFKATEFTGIFQKIKLSIILLGRLSPHIRDPNAADIVHHLMPPLAFLMDACGDLFDEELQRDVVSPLLTSQAVTLLSNCLNSREMTVWEACGEAWRTPKRDWQGESVPYRPLFYDGWSPGYLDFTEDSQGNPVRRENSLLQKEAVVTRSRSRDSSNQEEKHNGRSMDKNERDKKPSNSKSPIRKASDTESDLSDGSVFRMPADFEEDPDDKEAFRDKLMERGANIALVTYAWTSKNSKELTVRKGEYLEVLNNDKKWWRCRNYKNKIGHVPYTLLTTIVYKQATFQEIEVPDPPVKIPDPTYDEQTVSPRHRKQPEPPQEPETRRKSSRRNRHHSPRSPSSSPDPAHKRKPSPTPSVIPPPPPQPTFQHSQPGTLVVRQKKSHRSPSIETNFSMQDELRHVLTAYSEEKAKKPSVHKTPDVFIDQRSTAKEVQKWLKEKQFSGRVLAQCEGLNGKQMLALDRKGLEKTIGKEEGARLDSQITLSRNHTKYTQGKNSELRAVLEKAKKRAEKSKAMADDRHEVNDDDDYDDPDSRV